MSLLLFGGQFTKRRDPRPPVSHVLVHQPTVPAPPRPSVYDWATEDDELSERVS